MNPRIIAKSKLEGFFGLPIGLRFLQREAGELPKWIEVSTVCLEGGHLEDPLGICEPEHGYETMVFLEDCSFFSVFTAHYETREQAEEGHRSAIEKLIDGELPLAIQLKYYYARDPAPLAAAE